jgi:L-iditol 2-dehydrogenase
MSMRQAVIVGPEAFAVRRGPRPVLRGPGEILLRTIACGLCSGDLMPWYLARKVGTVLGHEPVGRAIEVGAGVTTIRPGDLVFVHHHAPCLACPECRRGAHVHCPTWKRTALDPGGMAETIRVPAEIVAVDAFAVNDLHPEQALFIEPVGCCVKAFERLGGRKAVAGRRVVVVGCGIMGLLNIQVARAYGAAEVVAVEPNAARLVAARNSGAMQAWTPEEAGARLRHWADIVVIGPGHSEAIRQALDYVRPGGSACLFAPTAPGVLTPLDLGELYFREVSLIPAYSCGPVETAIARDLIATGGVRPRELITHRFALDDVQAAYDTARSGGAAIKIVVTLSERPRPVL